MLQWAGGLARAQVVPGEMAVTAVESGLATGVAAHHTPNEPVHSLVLEATVLCLLMNNQ